MIKLTEASLTDLALFRWRRIGQSYVLTNDVGEYLLLGPAEFSALLEGKLSRESLTWRLLDEKHFINTSRNQQEIKGLFRLKFRYVQTGTSLHIVIPTLRCNQCCIYCHAKARDCRKQGYDMDRKTARKVVDAIFECPGQHITIEFQGGEPLLNWDIVVYIINYALRKNKQAKKNLRLTVVSNLTLMTEEHFDFLLKKQVGICSSLDGPRHIHDRHRPMLNGESSYELATYWLKRISRLQPHFGGGALVTVSRLSLDYPEQIVDEYVKRGMFSIPLRPISTLGYAGERRHAMGITAQEYIRFYYRCLDYILELNQLTREIISDRMSVVVLQKIFGGEDPGYLDLRSPCGAGCGQTAYFYDGSVYTCDEARMLGEDSFKLGNVHTHSYQELMESRNMKAAVMASCIDGLYCDYCAYKPYCGVCPVVNWKEYGSLYAQPNVSFMCQVHKAMFDYIFRALQDREKTRIIKSWIGL